MKILLKILYVIIGNVALILIIAAFLPKSYLVEREVVLNKPNSEVFEFIKLLKNQNKYSKWANMDPNMKTEFRGIDGTVGFVSAWDSNKKDVGKGEQTITRIVEGERVEYDLHFIKPFDSKSLAYMTTNAEGDNATKVTWGFKGIMPYPMNLMLVFMDLEKAIGADLDEGLTNFKKILDN